MFFVAAKLLTHLERPGDLLVLLLAIGALLIWLPRWRRAGIVLVSGVAFAFLLVALLPLAAWVRAPLENRFPRPALPSHVDGIAVLGGAVDPKTSARRGIPSLNADAERMTEFVRLAKLYPRARLLFSGGSSSLTVDPARSEAGVARLFFRRQGLDIRRVTFEARSRDTYENALFSKRLVRPSPGEVWLLVATAEDVPRIVGIFHKLGWPILPVPVAYKTDSRQFDFAQNLHLLDEAMHEWLGLVAYRLAGRTDALFPSPERP
jgi:uncharacterized SAM-binding protein YcdF (DUF218 family)